MEEEKGDNQNQVSLGVDSYLPLGHFCVCVVKRMKKSHWASRGKQGRDLIAIRAIISTFVMNSQGQEKGKWYETPIVVQEQGSKIDELATANTDPAIRQIKWYASVHSCSKISWQQQEKQ